MLAKTNDIEVPDLVEKARELIEWSVKQDNTTCFIPYIDESLREIRYLQFVKMGENWIYVNSQKN